MKIKWLGHSCFLLTSDTGVKVLTDPFDSHVGYRLPAVEADIITTSHGHSDHNYIQAVKGRFLHISQPGNFKHAGIRITGVPVYHDEVQGAKRGKNIVYIFEIDGLRICHCGDLGHIPTYGQVSEIGKVDILLIPVGGTYTLNADEAVKVVELLKPELTIPMHYKTAVLSFPIDGVDKFLAAAGVSSLEAVACGQEIEVDPADFPVQQKIFVPDYK